MEPCTDSLFVALERTRFELTFVKAIPSLEFIVLSGSSEFVQGGFAEMSDLGGMPTI